MVAIRHSRMASTKSGCGAAKSCARACTPRWLNCGVWDVKAGASLCPGTTIFCIGREKAKLSYFWKHCYGKSRSGRYLGSLTNPDTGCPVETDGVRLSALDFEKKRLHQIVEDSKAGKTKYSALWQADGNKIVRMAPTEYMGRFMPEWWDYAIADEIHQLAGDTAQGNALGVLNKTARRFLGLTGTLLSGYADDLFNTLFRTDARRMTEDGYEWGSAGRERFTRDFGVIETIERITVEDNACSKKTKKTVTIKRKPGASPLLFGKYLMDHCAFIGLEDISDGLPSYREEVVPVAMEEPLKTAYEELEEEITACLKEHRGNSSVASTMLNALLAWPDHPYGFGTLYGSEFDPETKCRESFVIAETVDLDKNETYAKERALIEEVKAQLARGRKCQVFAVYTNKHDVTARLEQLFRAEGIRASILRASVPTHRREAWYREQLRRGIDVAICHPKIVETGLDLLDFPTILFHETGYSLHTLRQSSRRSWRIGQRRPVEVKFFAYAGTMQEVCLRLMGKKLLVALAMEGKFASEGLQAIDGDDDMLTAMARELVENKGIGESLLIVSGVRSASCGPRRRRRQRKKRRTRRLSKGKLMPLRCCRCRSSRFRVQPSWRLTVHRAVPRAEIHLPVNCRSSDMPTETTVLLQLRFWCSAIPPAHRRSDSTWPAGQGQCRSSLRFRDSYRQTAAATSIRERVVNPDFWLLADFPLVIQALCS